MPEVALLSIKEFSALSGIERTTLRYWDEIGLFSPQKRNESTGYRYYAAEQIIAVNFITTLSRLGIPLKVISEIKDRRTPERIRELLGQQEIELDREMRRLRESYSIIHTVRDLINQGLRDDEAEISVRTLPDLPLIRGPVNDFKEHEGFYEVFTDFCKQASQLRINLHYPIGGYFDSLESFVANPARPTNFFSIDPTGYDRRSAGIYLVAYQRGYYGEMGDAPARILRHAKEKNLKLKGPVYVIYPHNEITLKDSCYLAQMSIAVA